MDQFTIKIVIKMEELSLAKVADLRLMCAYTFKLIVSFSNFSVKEVLKIKLRGVCKQGGV